MPQQMAFGEATITSSDPDDPRKWEGVQATIRGTTLSLRNQDGTPVATIEGVTAAVRVSRKRWTVRFGPAEPTLEVRRKDCGCGA